MKGRRNKSEQIVNVTDEVVARKGATRRSVELAAMVVGLESLSVAISQLSSGFLIGISIDKRQVKAALEAKYKFADSGRFYLLRSNVPIASQTCAEHEKNNQTNAVHFLKKMHMCHS